MEIRLNKSVVLSVAAVAILLIAAVIFFFPSGESTSASISLNLKSATSAQMAEAVTRAFYTVDYTRPSAWLEAMQPYSTDEGVKIMRDVVAPSIFTEFARFKTKSESKQVKVKWKSLMGSGYSETAKMDWELHLVEVALDPAVKWPGTTGTFTANVLLNKTAEGWRFTSFFSDDVAKTLINSLPTKPAVTVTPTK